MRLPLLFSLFLFTAVAVAAPRVSVVALFNGQVMLEIDGRRQLLRVGQASVEGVRLLDASASEAILEIDGRRHRLGLSRTVGGSYSEPQRKEVPISRNGRGMYVTAGSINGMPMSFLVDTGASIVAMNARDAARAGIDFHLLGTRMAVQTASGVATGYRVMLDSVSVGGISVSNVAAVVLDGADPNVPLLGMSFLGRLKLRHEGNLMVLEQP